MRRPLGSLARIAAAALLTLAQAPAAAQGDVETDVSLEPRVVGLDGTVRFTIEVEGPGLVQPRLRPRFELENLEIVGGPDNRQGLELRDGGGRWRYSWTWYLRPLEAGGAAVAGIRLLVGERELDLATRRIRAVPGGPPGVETRREPNRSSRSRLDRLLERYRPGREGPGARREGAPQLFLRSEVEPASPYVGQRTVYTTYLYTRVRVVALRSEELPEFEGCWTRAVDLGTPPQERVEVDGVVYVRYPLLRRELYPLRAGVLELGRVRARLGVERPLREGSSLRSARVRQEVVRESNPVALPVRPLPAADGTLATRSGERLPTVVGPVEVSVRLEPPRLPVGRSAILTVRVTGEGNLDGLPPPPVPAPEGVDVLGPEEGSGARSAVAAGGRLRLWRYLVVPQRRGHWELAPVEIPWFDPVAEEYRLASSSPATLVAHAEAVGEEGRTGERLLHPVRSAALPPPPERAWRRVLPWVAGVPWLLALALLAAHRAGALRRAGEVLAALRPEISEPTAGGSRGTPRAQRSRILRRFRRDLDRALAEERPRRAAAGLERAWRHLLSDGLGVPQAAPVSAWPEELGRRSVPVERRARLEAFLDDLHYLRYAPELSDAAALAGELAARSRRLARELLD